MTAATFRRAFDWISSSISEVAGPGGRERAAPARPRRPSVLPENYLVEFIAGTFGPASSGRGLTGHLESEQRVRRVVSRTNLGVVAAQDLEESSRRKLEEVQVTRAVKCKHELERILDHLESSPRRERDRPHVIRELFGLDDSPVAQRIAVRMAETRFLERLAEETAGIREGPLAELRRASTANRFIELEGRFRTEFASFVADYELDEEGLRRPISDDKTLKIVNRVFDALAPRMFLIGHSQGGLVALRTMQLGMRRVRVKDSRRFLYSPRSGRVHRYSPVALAIGLGAPFDGLERSPKFDAHGGHPLREEELPCWVRRLMPGVGQMLHDSAFLRTLRGAFIPFDCSALSIANPEDGLVDHERTRLPVGDFVNMHNLDVGSSERFDLADIAPEMFRPTLEFGPGYRFRKLLNEDPRFEGLRQHCSFLVDLGSNWDVEQGEIVRQIFSDDDGRGLFDEMMLEVNFDGLREQLIANVLYRLRRSDPSQRRRLAWMAPRLRHMIREERLPFHHSLDKRASLALNHTEPQ